MSDFATPEVADKSVRAPAAPPCLARQMAGDIKGLRAEMEGIQATARAAGHLYPAAAEKMTGILQRLIVMGTYLRGMETTLSAKQHAGTMEAAPRQTPHDELELVACATSNITHRRMVASLHRAGDHSMDEALEADRSVRAPFHKEGRA